MSQETPEHEVVQPKQQWLPLLCINCERSAYLVDLAMLARARSITVDMLRKTDDAALEPHFGMTLACPYCGDPLGIAKMFSVVGGGWEIRFRFPGIVGETT